METLPSVARMAASLCFCSIFVHGYAMINMRQGRSASTKDLLVLLRDLELLLLEPEERRPLRHGGLSFREPVERRLGFPCQPRFRYSIR